MSSGTSAATEGVSLVRGVSCIQCECKALVPESQRLWKALMVQLRLHLTSSDERQRKFDHRKDVLGEEACYNQR